MKQWQVALELSCMPLPERIYKVMVAMLPLEVKLPNEKKPIFPMK